MRFSFKFDINGIVQDCREISQYHLGGEQAEDSTAKRSVKILSLATKYTKYGIHFNGCVKDAKTLYLVLFIWVLPDFFSSFSFETLIVVALLRAY